MLMVETNGVDTYYERTGEGSPIVFIHCATSDRQLWGACGRPTRRRVYLHDVRVKEIPDTGHHSLRQQS